jgi:hypothetical protein
MISRFRSASPISSEICRPLTHCKSIGTLGEYWRTKVKGRDATLDETAAFLCRAGTPLEVAAKAKELGLKWQMGGTRRKPKPSADDQHQ